MVCTALSSVHDYWENYSSDYTEMCWQSDAFVFLSFFIFNLLTIEGYLLYRISLFSVKPQNESAIGIHISLPFWTSFPSTSPSHPSRLLQSPHLFPEPHSKFPLAIYFTYGNVSFPIAVSIHLTLSSSLPMSLSLFSMYVSPLLPCK